MEENEKEKAKERLVTLISALETDKDLNLALRVRRGERLLKLFEETAIELNELNSQK